VVAGIDDDHLVVERSRRILDVTERRFPGREYDRLITGKELLEIDEALGHRFPGIHRVTGCALLAGHLPAARGARLIDTRRTRARRRLQVGLQVAQFLFVDPSSNQVYGATDRLAPEDWTSNRLRKRCFRSRERGCPHPRSHHI